jgi:hypothetical protein
MYQLLIDNLLNPALLFFVFGIIAVRLKSDLEIPHTSSKFIAMYLLLSIGFNGGQELSHSEFNIDILSTMIFSVLLSLLIPIYVFFVVKKRLGVDNAGAISSSYGSVSAVTFVTAITFLEMCNVKFDGYMVATLALMEAPAIIMGVLLHKYFSKEEKNKVNISSLFKHSLTNSSVLLILASLVIGFLANEKQAMDIKPFTTDIFKGFLAIFLLDMGIKSGKKIKAFFKNGKFAVITAIAFSLINGTFVALFSGIFMEDIGNRFLMTVLAASASYIAVPAAMKIAIPKSNPGVYLPMALAISFPFNITIGFPIYYYLCSL